MSELVLLEHTKLGFQGFIQSRDIYQASDESFNFFILPSAWASLESSTERGVVVHRDLESFLLGKSFEEVIEYNISVNLKTEHLKKMKCFPARIYPPSLVTRVLPCLERLFTEGEMLDRSFTIEKVRALEEVETYKKTLYQRVGDLDHNAFIQFLREFEKELAQRSKKDKKRGFLIEELYTLKNIGEKKQYGSH